MSDRDALRRLGILSLIASCGEIGASKPSLIAGLRMLTEEQVIDGLAKLLRRGLVVKSARPHPDGDRRVIYYHAAEDLELLASNV
jgi:DNA-binding MarR family transcriptional regulator